MFSRLNLCTSVKYFTMNEFPLQPTAEFLFRRVWISNTDGSSCETVIMEVKLAVKVLVAMRITNNHGASTVRARGLLICSPAYCNLEMYTELGIRRRKKEV